ncbi:DUF222 domain-containing protein [Microbacterium sp.]|uniref:HNH endonuclease signature motif containing protein n=1 Tax=Microbacterium sp. TaxID=51671 RepID=UPI0028128DD0|nr:DUF222 domain-containing protein [Microbacterium sp.]
MAIFSEIDAQVAALRALLGADADGEELADRMSALDDKEIVDVIGFASGLMRGAERIGIVGAGIAAARSTREVGHAGLAQTRGHRNPAGLVQELTGVSRNEAQKQIRLGEAVLDAVKSDKSPASPQVADVESDAPAPPAADRADSSPWHAPLGASLMRDEISSAQHDAILRGLGEPPDDSREAREVWGLAVGQLILEAPQRTPEELRNAARTIRDQLDPDGAMRRFDERFERRSLRMYTDADGRRHANIAFDDEGAAWVQTIVDSALRPRRGGPRFVDDTERARAEELSTDPRTNDQLAYDLILDVLRAGALADAKSVFGTRQAGVRLVQVVDTAARADEPTAPARTEDGLITVPGPMADQHACDAGTVRVSVDRAGNPLDVGREQRLFTPKQRIALAIRDGGCRWRGCDRPASYCEAHHVDHFSDGGRTDVDRGILLCRFHHMNLHHGRWRISREDKGDFVLHHPSGDTVVLKPRLALAATWAGIDPPPRRFRPRAA